MLIFQIQKVSTVLTSFKKIGNNVTVDLVSKYWENMYVSFFQVCTYWGHLSHPTLTLNDAVDSQREILSRLLEGASGHIHKLKQSLTMVNGISEDLLNNYRLLILQRQHKIIAREAYVLLYMLMQAEMKQGYFSLPT